MLYIERGFAIKLVENFNEIKANVKTLDSYLKSKTDPEYSYGLNLDKKGTCFIAVKENDIYKFYPSRFMGYVNNSIEAHLNNEERDGRDTNPAISKILGNNPLHNPTLDKIYREYGKSLGFTANDKGSFG